MKTTPGPSAGTDRMARMRKQVLDPKRQVVAFDLENTLIASNVVESYSWLATRRLDTPERVRYALRTMVEAPGLLKLDRADRTDFLRHFYRRYEDAPVEQIEQDARELFTQLIITKSFPAGMRRVREHRALGHRTILITGALSFAVEGLASAVRRDRRRRDVDPSRRYVLRRDDHRAADRARRAPRSCRTTATPRGSTSTSAWRTPTRRRTSRCSRRSGSRWPSTLRRGSRRSPASAGWLVEHWSKSPGGPRPRLPIGPLLSERQRRERFDAASGSARSTRSVDEGAPGLPLGAAPRPRPHRLGRVTDRRDEDRPARLRGRRRTRAPGPRLAAGAHPPRGHLRVRPVARRGSRIAVLRRLGVVPVHPRP